MAPIRVFHLAWPTGADPASPSQVRNIQCALGHYGGASGDWALIRTSAPDDEYEPREYCRVSTRASADPAPAPSATTGNPIFTLKDYSENEGVLKRLEDASVVRHTGRTVSQGFVQLHMVEVLVPVAELIRRCGMCERWEDVGEARYKKCTRCKVKWYCSVACQAEDWKEHKPLCKAGLTEDEVFAADKAKTGDMLKTMGFKTLNV